MAQLPKDKHITYQLQYRKCGKPNCSTCRTGRGHGPYWYAYWHERTRLRSSYIGKTLPQASVSDTPPAAPPQSRHDTSPPDDRYCKLPHKNETPKERRKRQIRNRLPFYDFS